MRKLFIFALIAAALVGCGVSERQTGELVVRVNNGIMADVIMPDDSLVADTYYITGTGVGGPADGTTFSGTLGSAGGTLAFDVMPGTWDVTVEVYNAAVVSPPKDAMLIGSGEELGIVVNVGTPKGVSILCLPMPGDGDLFASITWEPAVVADPHIGLALRSFVNRGSVVNDVDVAMTLGTGEIATGNTTLTQGWYLGRLSIMDGAILNAGIVRAVRMMANAETHWNEHVYVNTIQGSLTLDIGFNPGMPLDLEGTTEGVYTVYRGAYTDFEVTGANNDADTTLITYWFVDGAAQPVGTGDTFSTNGMAFNPGTFHYLSALAFQSDGRRLGELQYTLQVEEPTSEMLRIAVSSPNYYQATDMLSGFEIRPASAWATVLYGSGALSAHAISWTSPQLAPGDYYVTMYNAINFASTWTSGEFGRYLVNDTPQSYGAPVGTPVIITIPHQPGMTWAWSTQPAW